MFKTKIKFHKNWLKYAALAVVFGFILVGGIIAKPSTTFASCNPNPTSPPGNEPLDPVIYGISQPDGTYTNPSTLSITITGESSYFCSGWDGKDGGYGFGERSTTVQYSVTNSSGSSIFSNGWSSPTSWNGSEVQTSQSFTINDSFDASSLPSGTYTITADAYNTTIGTTTYGSTSTYSTSFQINRTVSSNYDLDCTISRTVSYSSNPSASTSYSVYAYNLSSGYANTINTSLSYSSGPSANPSSTNLTYSGYASSMNIVYGGLSIGTYYLTFYGNDGSLTRTCNATLVVQGAYPVVDLYFNSIPDSVNLDNETYGTISWVTQNATSCTASTVSSPTSGQNTTPAWNSSYTVSPVASGSLYVDNIQFGTTYNFFLNCSGPGGTASDYVQVSATPGTPSADIQCKVGSFSFNDKCVITTGGTGRLVWNTQNITTGTCELFKNGVSQGIVTDNRSGTGWNTGNLYSSPTDTYTYTLTCSTPGYPYSVSDSITIGILTADLLCNTGSGASQGPCTATSGSTANLTWTSTHADACSIDNSVGSVATSNTSSGVNTATLTNPPTTTITYTLSCQYTGQASTTDPVTITVTSAPAPTSDMTCRPTGSSDPYTNGPCSVVSGSGVDLSWTTANITSGSCVLTDSEGVNYGAVENTRATNRPYRILSITKDINFTLTCNSSNSPYVTSDSVAVTVTAPALSVNIQCTDSADSPPDGPCSVSYGASATISWTSSNCTSLSIPQFGAVGASGSQSTGALTSSQTYTITCVGVSSTTYDSVDVAVGSDWTLACTPTTQTVTQGDSGSYSLSTTGLGGFSSGVTFSGPSYNTTPSVAPSFTFYGNGQLPNATTTAYFTTTTSTTPGTYTITFTGTAGSSTKTCSRQLIIQPYVPTLSVDIDCTDSAGSPPDGPCSVSYGASATISWTSSNCTSGVYINPFGWVGSSGSQSTGGLTLTRTYSIVCYGANGSEAYDSVQVVVGTDWSLSCTPSSITVTQGDSSSYSLATTGLGGFSSGVTFSGPSYNTTPSVAPSFTFYGNGQVPNATTTAYFTTTTSTTPGTYTLTFTGAGGSTSHSCSVQLIIQAYAPPLTADLNCSDSAGGPKDGPCTVTYGDSATLIWTSSNCTSVSIDNGIGSVSANNSTSTGSLTSSRTYTLTCNGTGGPVYATVDIIVGTDWSLSCTPSSITVTQGDSSSYSLATTGLGGFSSGVTFSGPSYNTTPSVAPSFTFYGNGQVPNATTTAYFTTTTSTTPGTYTLTFSGTGGTTNHSCAVQLIVQAYVAPLAVDIDCTDSTGGPKDGPCTVTSGNSATISWTSSNCTSVYVDTVGWVSASGSQSTGALYSSQTYTITCNGTGGPLYDSVTVAVGADWSLACSPSSVTITQGDTTSYSLSTTGVGGFSSTVAFSNPSYSPTPTTAPSVTFYGNDQAPSATTTAILTTTTSTTAGTYTLTFSGTASGKSGTTKTCNVQLIVQAAAPTAPGAPVVSTSNATCGQIAVNWTPGPTPPSVTSYTVYYSSPSSTGTWTDISGSLSSFSWSGTFSFTHSSSNPYRAPSSSNNYYKVRAFNGASYTDSNVSGPVGIIPCTSNTTSSDKDLKSVAGLISKTFTPVACSGNSEVATLPNNSLFSPGDVVTFQINVCNSGSLPLTGVSVIDTLSNLTSPASYSSSPSGCVTTQSYDSISGTITFNLADIAASSGSTQLCSITFTAVVTTPVSATSSIYRFQNSARIYASEITADPSTYPLGYLPVSTPPYLFGVTSNIPDRGETSPQ